MFVRLLLGLLVLLASPVQGQGGLVHYTSDQGLPSSEVYDVICDRKGFVWVSTDRGVARFDGYRFENFYTSDGLTDNIIIEMFEDEKRGHIWFSANSGRLCYYDYADARIHEYQYNDLLRKNLSSLVVVKSIRVDSAGTLFVGYLNYGAVSITRDGALTVIQSIEHASSYTICFQELEGQPWIYSTGRIPDKVHDTLHVQIDVQGIRFHKTFPYAGGRFIDEYMCRRKNGTCLFSIPGYLLELAPGREPYIMPLGDDVRRIYEDRQGRLWICLRHEGLRMYEPGEGLRSRYTNLLPGKYTNAICEDKEQGLWIGVYLGALYYKPMVNLRVEKLPGIPDRHIVKSIGAKGGDLYFGMETDRLYCLHANGLFDSLILPVRHVTWIQDLDSGLMLYGQRRCYIYKNRIRVLDSQEKHVIYSVYKTDSFIYAGSYSVIKHYSARPPYDLLKYTRLFPTRFEAIYNADGHILFGNSAGVQELVGDTVVSCNAWFEKPCRTNAIQKAGRYLAFSTLGEGIRFLDSAKHMRFTLSTHQGLLSNNINALCFNDRSLWAASSFGLNEIRFEGDSFRVYAYTLANGLQASEIRQIQAHEGRLWMIGPKGVYSLRFSEIRNNTESIPVHILSVANADTVYAGSALLREQEVRFNSILRIRYVGLSYKQYRNVQYRYRLQGKENGWIQTTNTEVEFAFLSEGHYTFELSASNEDGEWGPPVSFRFFIEPPFWQTWWFVAGIGFLVFGLILLVFILRILRLQRENRIRQQLYEYQQQALVARMNPHFIFNSLNSIYYFIFTGNKDMAGKYLARFASLMRLILELSTKDHVKLEEELRALELYMELEAWRFNGKFTFMMDVSKDIDTKAICVPPMLMQPFVENAIKHGLLNLPEGGGQLQVSLRLVEGRLECVVEDNGIGREAAAELKASFSHEVHRSAGIAITLQRLETACEKNRQPFLLEYTDKTLAMHSETGTRVRFYIPYSYDKSIDH